MEHALVSTLIDQITMDWDPNIIDRCFNPRDGALVRQIPICIDHEDEWCWRGNARGHYTVKGYRCLLGEFPPSSFNWKGLWKIKVRDIVAPHTSPAPAPNTINAVNSIPNDSLLCQVDAAIFSAGERTTVGAVLLDIDRHFLAVRNGPTRCSNDIYTAEVMAVREALSWLKDRNNKKVIMESDSHLVCQNLLKSARDFSAAGCLIADCVSLIRFFDTFSIRFIYRSSNSLA
ncbi:hypothetical protein OROGR_003898 [Orobanche gracilis]